MDAEGWYLDPYGRHEQRWFSAGTPTALVHDDGKDGHDEPPDRPPDGPLVRPPEVDSDVPEYDREDAADDLFGTVYGSIYTPHPRDE